MEPKSGFTRERRLGSNVSAQLKIVSSNHCITAFYTSKSWISFSIMEEMVPKSPTNFENSTQHFKKEKEKNKANRNNGFWEILWYSGLFGPQVYIIGHNLTACLFHNLLHSDSCLKVSFTLLLQCWRLQDTFFGYLSSLYLNSFFF